MNGARQVCLQGCCPNPIFKMAQTEEEETTKRPSTASAASRHNFVAVTKSSLFPNAYFNNHESIPSLQDSFYQFVATYPKYVESNKIDQIRTQEYFSLSSSNNVCLDYIGVGLFSQNQAKSTLSGTGEISSSELQQHSSFSFFVLLSKPMNLKSTLVDSSRISGFELAFKRRIMDFLRISDDDYSMVFTANKSSAFKLLAESYPFQSSKKLLSVYDHKSEALDGMINEAEKRGARAMSAEFKWPRLRIHSSKLEKMIEGKKRRNRGLFVFPLLSRMTGAAYSYQWMARAKGKGWHVLLDASALGPKGMDSFGMSLFQADFVVCSFYKIFGENPTGFGCLFVKKSAAQILEDSTNYGIVSVVSANDLFGLEFPEDHNTESEQFSKDEVEFRCLDHVDSLGLMLISNRGRYLINWLVSALMKLQHPNRLSSFPLVKIYGPKVKFDRGQALSFNIFDWKKEKVEPALVQKLANRNKIALRHGFLKHLSFPDEYKLMAKETERSSMKNGKGIEVVTVVIPFLANFEDVYRLWAFVALFLDADFVEKERWRSTALTQKITEV